MKREEAVAIFKEVMHLAEHMGTNAFNLQFSKNDDPTEGYRIRIKMETDGIILDQTTDLAKKHKLVVKEEKGEVAIFKPKKAS